MSLTTPNVKDIYKLLKKIEYTECTLINEDKRYQFRLYLGIDQYFRRIMNLKPYLKQFLTTTNYDINLPDYVYDINSGIWEEYFLKLFSPIRFYYRYDNGLSQYPDNFYTIIKRVYNINTIDHEMISNYKHDGKVIVSNLLYIFLKVYGKGIREMFMLQNFKKINWLNWIVILEPFHVAE